MPDAGVWVERAWEAAVRAGSIRSGTRRAGRFGAFGEGSVVVFPWTTLLNVRYVHVGARVLIGADVVLSAGMSEGQPMVTDPVLRIGDRCVIGRGSGFVAHFSVEVEDDVWFGHHVFVTDQNHGWDDPGLPVGEQHRPERPVRIGAGSWIGHGTVVLPGAQIGRGVVVGAGSVVTGSTALPDRCLAAGNPARVLRSF